MRREQKTLWFTGATVDTTGFASDMLGWFINQASISSASQADLWFLAHAAPGIIWGKLVQGKLHLSSDYFPAVSPPLEAQTLWEARLFCQSTQLHLWRTTAGFAAWRIDERPKGAADPAQNFAFDEWHRLWGTTIQATSPAPPAQESQTPRFTLLADGAEGLRLALPLLLAENQFTPPKANPRYRPARLLTRSYVAFDDDGRACVTASRLVDLAV